VFWTHGLLAESAKARVLLEISVLDPVPLYYTQKGLLSIAFALTFLESSVHPAAVFSGISVEEISQYAGETL
jgi:hypothetical protein